MTNPCYDFALRRQSNIPNSYVERRHTPQRTTSPATPYSQATSDEFEYGRQRGDRGRWKTDGRINIAGGFEDPSTLSCPCHQCVLTHERNSYDHSGPVPPRRCRTARRPYSAGNGLDEHGGGRKPPPTVPKVDHSLWNPMQSLREPRSPTEREREYETSRLKRSPCKYRSSSRLTSGAPSRSRDLTESYSRSRTPQRTSKVRSLRRTPSQQRKQSSRKSPPGRCSGSKIPSLGTRRRSSIDTSTPPWAEKFDIACQTRRGEFPLTPEETPRASPNRRLIAYDSFYYDRLSHNAKPSSCAGQRRPSPCRCGAAAACTPAPAATAAPRGCCCSCSYCVSWQETRQRQKPEVAPQGSCQGSRHENCCAAVGCHHGNHHGLCLKAEPPSACRHTECSQCHQPLPLIK